MELFWKKRLEFKKDAISQEKYLKSDTLSNLKCCTEIS